MSYKISSHWIVNVVIVFLILGTPSLSFAQEAAESETLSATEIEQIRDQIKDLSDKLEHALQGNLEEQDRELLQRFQELEQIMKQKDKTLEHDMKQKEKEIEDVVKVYDKAILEKESAMARMDQEMQKAMKQMEKEMQVEVPVPPTGPSHKHSGAFDSFQGHKIKEKIEKTMEVDSDDELIVRNQFGSIVVTAATEANRLDVKVDRHAGAETQEQAQRIMEAMKINVEKEGNEIVVEVDARNGQNYEGNIMAFCDIYVTTPQLAEITTHNRFGSTYLRGIESEIETHNSFGSTTLENCQSDLELKNSHGSLQLKQHRGNVEIQNSFGSLFIDGLQAETADIESQYGETKLRGLSPDIQLEGEFGFGPVFISVPKAFRGTITAHNRMAPIHTPEHWNVESGDEDQERVPRANTGFRFSNRAETDVEIKIDIPHPPKMEKEIEVKLGDGPGVIDVESQFGPIHFEQDL